MWDSAKKPIKIRSVLQSNGMRHFIVNEETEEIYSNYLQQQQLKKSAAKSKQNDTGERPKQVNSPEQFEKGRNVNQKTLQRANSLGEWNCSGSSENADEFFGVAGSKICNSKKHKGYHPHSRYICNLTHPSKDMQVLNGYQEISSRCPHLRSEMLDLIPVKSPVIKKLINGRVLSSRIGQTTEIRGNVKPKDATQSTTLCSRIMTWIDLEVKRNAGKGRTPGLPFSSEDLNIVNELNLPSQDDSCSSSSSTSESGSNSSSGSYCDGTVSSSSSLNNSLPKLVPCWKKNKEQSEGGNKLKKSVRIAEDLPRWGKMKRRLRKKDRSWSLNELYDDGDQEPVWSSRKKDNGKPELVLSDMLSGRGNGNGWSSGFEEKEKKKETDPFMLCDENLRGTGRLQVHIFLPQTVSGTSGKPATDSGKGLSGRSDDSTS